MKLYQFLILASLLAIIVGGMIYKAKKKKACSCSKSAETLIESEAGE